MRSWICIASRRGVVALTLLALPAVGCAFCKDEAAKWSDALDGAKALTTPHGGGVSPQAREIEKNLVR